MGKMSKFTAAFKAKVAFEALQEKHPARSAGTEGCIGLIDDDPIVLRRARDLMRNTIKKRGSLQLHVIIK